MSYRKTVRTAFAVVAVLMALMCHSSALAQCGQLKTIQVDSIALKGNLLNDSTERDVTVYLPPGYSEELEKRYPVVYLLHGYMATNKFWSDGEYVTNLATIADDLIAQGQIEELIVVAPSCRNTYQGSWYTNSPVTGNWEDFVTNELVSHIDAKYRTLAKRASRGIAGHSMGGYGALKLAMRNPDRYSTVYAMAPALTVFSEILHGEFEKRTKEAASERKREGFDKVHWHSQSIIALAAAVAPNPQSQPFLADLPIDSKGNLREHVWQRWLQHDVYTMIGSHRKNLLKFKAISVDCGSDDILLPMNRMLVTALRDADIPIKYEEFQGNHLNRLTERLRDHVLPLFSTTLAHSKILQAVGAEN